MNNTYKMHLEAMHKTLSSQDAAWIAACIDCEGTIAAYAKPNKIRKCRNVAVCIKVSMTCRLVPERLHLLCGGSFSGPHARKNPKHKSHYLWSIAPNACRDIIPQILPFLLTKKKQAEIVLEILRGNRHGRSMSNAQLVPLLMRMRELNFRGTSNYSDLDEIRIPKNIDPKRHRVEPISCACGCGKTLNRYDGRGRERTFAHGHNVQN